MYPLSDLVRFPCSDLEGKKSAFEQPLLDSRIAVHDVVGGGGGIGEKHDDPESSIVIVECPASDDDHSLGLQRLQMIKMLLHDLHLLRSESFGHHLWVSCKNFVEIDIWNSFGGGRRLHVISP